MLRSALTLLFGKWLRHGLKLATKTLLRCGLCLMRIFSFKWAEKSVECEICLWKSLWLERAEQPCWFCLFMIFWMLEMKSLAWLEIDYLSWILRFLKESWQKSRTQLGWWNLGDVLSYPYIDDFIIDNFDFSDKGIIDNWLLVKICFLKICKYMRHRKTLFYIYLYNIIYNISYIVAILQIFFFKGIIV